MLSKQFAVVLTQTYGIGILEIVLLYRDSAGCVMATYILRPYYSKAGHLCFDRELVGKWDIEYQIGTVPPKSRRLDSLPLECKIVTYVL